MARRTAWVDRIIDNDILTGGQALLSLLGTLTPIETRATTVVRIIVDLKAHPISSPPTVGASRTAIGIGVASQDAFAAGVGSVPDPESAADEPPRGWLYRNAQGIYSGSVETTDLARFKVDLRTKRKIDNGELYMIVTNTAMFGTTYTVTLVGIVRTLLLLP